MNVFRPLVAVGVGLALLVAPVRAEKKPKRPAANSRRVDMVLDTIKPLPDGRKTQLPLYLWPAMDPGPLDAASAERLVEELNRRGVGLVPIVSFVHWHTTAPPPNPDPQVKAMSRHAYQELLWHSLLRGARTFYLWCPAAEDVEECQAVHEVYAAAQEFWTVPSLLLNSSPATCSKKGAIAHEHLESA